MSRLVQRLAASLAAMAMLPIGAQAQDRDIKFTLDFIALGRHAPWYVAIGKGYFKEEKLNVTIVPSKGTADAIAALEANTSEFAFVDIPSLIAGGSSASSVRIVAVNYQKPPYCVFSLNPGANVRSAKDMAGIELGSSTASFVPRIHQAFMKLNGVDPSTLKVVNIDGSARVPMLAAKKVQAIDLFIMSEPAIKRAVQDAEPYCFLLGDHGLDIYSNSIGVRADFIEKSPEVVRGFVRAALRGWKDALANPEEAAQVQLQFLRALDPVIVQEEVRILKRLAITPDTEKGGYGVMTKEKMQRTIDFINQNVEVKGDKRTLANVIVEGFLPKEPVKP